MIDDPQKFRESFRRDISPYYSGALHFLWVTLGPLAVVVAAVSQTERITTFEWLTVPFAFLFANVVEYFAHAGPMHHRRPGADLLFERHTLMHHRFFTDQVMRADTRRDFRVVLFPPFALLLMVFVIDVPAALLAYYVFGKNVAALFYATSIGYYGLYEILHTAYHLPDEHLAHRLVPGLKLMRRHHQLHHNPQVMTRANFNVTFPICDWVFGTYYMGANPPTPAATKSPTTSDAKPMNNQS